MFFTWLFVLSLLGVIGVIVFKLFEKKYGESSRLKNTSSTLDVAFQEYFDLGKRGVTVISEKLTVLVKESFPKQPQSLISDLLKKLRNRYEEFFDVSRINKPPGGNGKASEYLREVSKIKTDNGKGGRIDDISTLE